MKKMANGERNTWLVRAAWVAALAWAGWVSIQSIGHSIELAKGAPLTSEDGAKLELRLTQKIDEVSSEIDARIDALPPKDWRDKLIKLEAGQTEMLKQVIRLSVLMEEHVNKSHK